jgi:hypothetical protein
MMNCWIRRARLYWLQTEEVLKKMAGNRDGLAKVGGE